MEAVRSPQGSHGTWTEGHQVNDGGTSKGSKKACSGSGREKEYRKSLDVK